MLRYNVATIKKNGQREVSTQSFDANTVIVGRGGRSKITVQNRLVSLEHAEFSFTDHGFAVTDLNSLSGVKVNSAAVKKRELAEGDIVQIGDLNFAVNREEGIWTLTNERDERTDEDPQSVIAATLKDLSITKFIPSMKVLSTSLALIVAGLFFAWPLSAPHKISWVSGPIANVHRMIGDDCASCHGSPFQKVTDERCTKCHNMTQHVEEKVGRKAPVVWNDFIKEHPALNQRCAECHMEHNGEHALVLRDDRQCSDCHGKMETLVSGHPNVVDFNDHPEFRVLSGNPGEQKKVSLANKTELLDGTQLKLNHKIHLEEGIRGADGPTTLTCTSCHRLSENHRAIEPINFEKNCQSCHPLTFDDRMPDSQVPHGDPDVVFNFMYAEYAKLYLASKTEPTVSRDFDLRQKPGYSTKVGNDPEKETGFAREVITADTRYSESILFKKTGCFLCHMVSEKEDVPVAQRISRYNVEKPKVPEHWLGSSIFSHGAHEEVACESCHNGVSQSEHTSDVLLPGVAACRDCHHSGKQTGKVQSTCIDCHSYHESRAIDFSKKRAIKDIIAYGGGN